MAAPAAAQAAGVRVDVPFRDIGPLTGGRVTAVAGIPGDYNVYYMGAAGGGLWKSVNGGQTWEGIFTHGPSASIGSIAIDPRDHDVVWVGTGETTLRNGSIDGAGLFRSVDGGKTWQDMGFDTAGQIGSILIDPENANVVLVGVMGQQWMPNRERGVFRTDDGGKTWRKVLYVDDVTGCIQIASDPRNPRIVFAAMWEAYRRPWRLMDGGMGSGIYRSTDGGLTFSKLTKGLPSGPLGRIGIAVAPGNPKRVYALIEARSGRLWRSDDRGDSWQRVSDNRIIDERPFYFSQIAVSPEDDDQVYFGAIQLLESDDGGRTVHRIDPGVHEDYHALWVDPTSGRHILVGNDGGAFETSDGGRAWQSFAKVPLGQYYAVAVAPGPVPGAPYLICGGLQDNAGWCGYSSDLDRSDVSGIDWRSVSPGDGDYLVPAPSNPAIIYMTVDAAYVYRYNAKTGLRHFIKPYWPVAGEMRNGEAGLVYPNGLDPPIAVSRTDADVVYYGANVVFKTLDGGQHWRVISPNLTRNIKEYQQIGGGPIEPEISGSENYDIIMSISIAPRDADVLWVGTDDGLIWNTRDDGMHWHNVTPGLPRGAPKLARIYQVGISPFDAGSAYVAMNADRMGDHGIYVYKTHDYGQSWTKITSGLPDVPGQVVREDPDRKGLLVLGTDRGLYCSLNDGGDWQPLNRDFPTTPVWDLHFVENDHALVVGTHGRGIFAFDNLRPLEELDAARDTPLYLFTPSPGILYNRQRLGEPPIPYYSVPNAPEGVDITYVVAGADGAAAKGDGQARVSIKSASGATIATLSGSAHAGLNSVVWNLRYDGPVALDFLQPVYSQPERRRQRQTGPMVLPGDYLVQVAYAGHILVRHVTVSPDPRLSISAATYTQHVRVGLQLRNELNALGEMLNQIAHLQSRLEDILHAHRANGSDTNLVRHIRAVNRRLTTIRDEVLDPAIQQNVPEDNLHAVMRLYDKIRRTAANMFSSYDDLPTASMQQSMQEQQLELTRIVGAYDDLVQGELARLSAELARDGLEPLTGASSIAVAPADSLM